MSATTEPSTPLETVTAAAREYQQALKRAEAARLEMNRAIQAAATSASTRKIADAAGVSFQRVHQIVKSA